MSGAQPVDSTELITRVLPSAEDKIRPGSVQVRSMPCGLRSFYRRAVLAAKANLPRD